MNVSANKSNHRLPPVPSAGFEDGGPYAGISKFYRPRKELPDLRNKNGGVNIDVHLFAPTTKRRIDFEKSLGDKTLYHYPSLAPFRKEHFDEDATDSEYMKVTTYGDCALSKINSVFSKLPARRIAHTR